MPSDGAGWLASAGALIEAAARKEDRRTLAKTRFLLHRPPAASRSAAGDPG
ncbi:ATP-dependent Clp protease proteolytic subunit [Burkholderia arboris]|uniref:ATP-dependent Clp protease proteolytic subunit n=1 Tax=Burkholderia arboris TaxID=488730 RepID=UPI002234FC28|nr:ATP-dependent Clp protease proteolytic subunit [Burkholderia arboris]